jgi:transcriptional regulator with XRE-family HTH domain
VEFGTRLDHPGLDAEASYRRMTLTHCLRDAREANGWTLKACAQALDTKPKQLSAMEAGDFETAGAEPLLRYVRFLGLEDLYRQWLTANAGLAAQLGLSAPPESAPRPAEWPTPKPFTLAPDTFRSTPEKRQAMQAQLAAVKNVLSGAFAGAGSPGRGLLDGALHEDPRREAAAPAIYQFKITLLHLQPAVWRRFQVPNDFTLGDLHRVVQIVLGWENDHLHEFRLRDARFGATHDPMGGPLSMEGSLDENEYRLCELGLRAKSKLHYEYDFGDGWQHQLVLEKALPHAPGFVPVCLEGARACPMEDSGGAWGYANKLEILADPKHPEHEQIAEWMGGSFDPEAFNLEAINHRLTSCCRPRRGGRRQRRG